MLLAAIVLGAVQFLLGSITARFPSYWGDEAATLAVSQRPLPDMLALLAHIDAVHGVYYVIQGVFLSLVGTDPFPARMLSVTALAATVGLTVILGARLAGPRAGIFAGVVASFLPGLVWAGTELRSVALATLLAVLTMLALERATREESRLRWGIYALMLTCATWVFVFSALLALPAAVLAVSRARVRPFFWSSCLAGLASAPIVVVTSTQVGQVSWISDQPGELLRSALVGQYFFGQRPYYAFEHPTAFFAAALAVLTLAMLIWFTRASFRRRRWSSWAVGVAWTLAPTVLLVGMTALGKPVYLERYLTFTAPGLCLLVGAALAAMSPRRSAALLTAFCVLATPILVSQKREGFKPNNFAALARFVDEHKAPGAAVIYSDVRAYGVPMAYPEAFDAVKDVALGAGPLETATFWGRVTPAGDVDLTRVMGRQVFVLTRTTSPDSSSSAAGPDGTSSNDPYIERLVGSGCVEGEVSAVTTLTAHILEC